MPIENDHCPFRLCRSDSLPLPAFTLEEKLIMQKIIVSKNVLIGIVLKLKVC
jgi:hypothetical protein